MVLESDYYKFEYAPAMLRGGKWRARGRLIRKDSGEAVNWFHANADASSAAEARLLQLAQAGFQQVSAFHPPPDWGRSSVGPKLIDRYLSLKDRLYGYFLEAEKKQGPDRAKVEQEAKMIELRELEELQQAISSLSEAEKVSLIAPARYQSENKEEPHILDILAAKKRLYALIATPSASIRKAYEELLLLLSQ